jgi:hypothetical protein
VIKLSKPVFSIPESADETQTNLTTLSYDEATGITSEVTITRRKTFTMFLKTAQNGYRKLVESGMPEEDAILIVPEWFRPFLHVEWRQDTLEVVEAV